MTRTGEPDFSMGGAPKPDSLFREYTFRFPRAELPVLDPNFKNPEASRLLQNERLGKPVTLMVDDLQDAVSAEMVVEYWGGHIGTSHQGFHMNQGEWHALAQPVGTPTAPEGYFRVLLGGAAVPVPLSEVREGPNQVLFTAGPQIVNDFGWGFYWMYSCTLRVYYQPGSKPSCQAKWLWPQPGDTLGEMPSLAVKCTQGFQSLHHVDYLAKYTDFPWSGTGLYHQWHLQSLWGQYRHTAASTDHTVTDEPLAATWNTAWIPDQDQPIELMARLLSLDGWSQTTPVVSDVLFKRQGRSVKMVKPQNVPQEFGSRVGKPKTCLFDVPSLQGATSARLVVSTWSAAHADAIGLNGKALWGKLGRVHDHSFDLLPVPLALLSEGTNEFFVFSETEEHMAEINWPGPVLLIEYAPSS